MKRMVLFLVMLFAALFVLTVTGSAATLPVQELLQAEETARNAAILPESLIAIEEGAFEGTSLVSVNMPESVTSIGDHAFAGNENLFRVRLPDSILDIAGDPFAGSYNVCLSGSYQSYGRNWALRKGIRFILESCYSARKEVRLYYTSSSDQPISLDEKRLNAERIIQPIREKRTGRSEGDLKAAAYNGVASLVVQSRYFP